MYDKESAPTDKQVQKIEYLSPMLDSALAEMREFSKKKQEGIVSETKIKILNRFLTDLREVLSGEESANYLDPLDEEKLPQNSDAVLVLGQYRAALDSFSKKHQKRVNYKITWITKEWIEDRGDSFSEDYEEDEDL